MESLTGENLFYFLTIVSYLVGSIPIGLVYAKLTGGTDPRTVGSGNIGATNMSRAGGKVAGFITLAGDVTKGALMAHLATTYLTDIKEISIVCFAVFAGHLFSVFLKFKGGKGVATAFGVYAVIAPIASLLIIFVFGLVLFLLRYVSLASVAASIAGANFIGFLPWYRSYIILALVFAVLIFIKHWSNFQKITAGTEDKIDQP